MKKFISAIVLFFVCAYCFDDATIPNVFVANTPARSGEVNDNFDSLKTAHNRTIDTVATQFFRKSHYAIGGDSTLQGLQLDSLRGNPDVDSIQGAPYFDGIFTDSIRSNPDIDSISGSPYINALTTPSVDVNGGNIDGTVIGAASATTGTFTTLIGDSINITKSAFDTISVTEATITDAIITSSSTTNSSTTNDTSTNFVSDNVDVGGGAIDGTTIGSSSATTGAFTTLTASSTASVDSLASTKGITCTNITASSTVNVDSLASTKGITCTNITASSTVNVDSLASTKGVTATTVNTGQGDNELYPMDQNVLTTSAPTFTSVNTGQGDNELYPMDQNVLTTSAPTFTSVNTGQGDNELYDMDQNVLTTSAPTFATVNTGQGDNELYDMDQNVLTTSDVVFDSIKTTSGALFSDNVRMGDASSAPLNLLHVVRSDNSTPATFGLSSTPGIIINNSSGASFGNSSELVFMNAFEIMAGIRNNYTSHDGGAEGNLGLYTRSGADTSPELRVLISRYGDLITKELSSGATPSSGFGNWYAKTDGLPYFKNDAGTEYLMGSAVSGSFTITLSVGCTTTPTATAYYTIVNDIVHLTLPQLLATSNTTTLTFSGLPAIISPSSSGNRIFDVSTIYDNTLAKPGKIMVTESSTLVCRVLNTANNSYDLNAFTSSGSKGTLLQTISYRVN